MAQDTGPVPDQRVDRKSQTLPDMLMRLAIRGSGRRSPASSTSWVSQAISKAPDQAQAQRLVDRIVAALGDARQYVRRSLKTEFSSNPASWALKFFSDKLVVGYPFDDDAGAAMAARFIIRVVCLPGRYGGPAAVMSTASCGRQHQTHLSERVTQERHRVTGPGGC